MRTRQLNETISQILPLQKNEDYENNDDAGCRERPKQGRNQRRDILQGSGRRLTDLDRYRSGLLPRRGSLKRSGRTCRGVLWLIELFAQVLKYVRCTFERPARCCRAAKRLDLFAHGELILR